jgi:hypothetical protein
MNTKQFEQLCHQVAVSRLVDLQGSFYIQYSFAVERRVQEMIGSVIEFMVRPSFPNCDCDALICDDHSSNEHKHEQHQVVTAQLPLGLQLDIPQLADEIVDLCTTSAYIRSSALTQLPPSSLIKKGQTAVHKKVNDLVSCHISEVTARELILRRNSAQSLSVQQRDRSSPQRVYKFESTKRKRAKRVLLSSLNSRQGKWNIYKCYW